MPLGAKRDRVILRQSTAVAIGGRAVLIEGPPGCGKSTLALALIDRGAVLVGDDGVRLDPVDDALMVHPPEPTAGLIEIRNVGLVRMACASAPACLLLTIDQDAPRFVDTATPVDIAGVAIPSLAFATCGAADALRAEHALRLHGRVA